MLAGLDLFQNQVCTAGISGKYYLESYSVRAINFSKHLVGKNHIHHLEIRQA